MIDNLIRDLQVLRKADLVIGKIWLIVLLRRFGLVALAGLIAVFGLAMANVAGFYGLQASVDPVWAASIVALIDVAIAGLVLLLAVRSRPGPELELAFEIRKMAVDSIQSDAHELKRMFDVMGGEIKDLKSNISQLIRSPLDTAAQKLLIPAALSIIKGFRSKRERA
jgi:hypothetical protein